MKNRSRRILICGGSGFIGTSLARELSKSGDEVIVLTRHSEGLGLLPDNVRFEKWNARTGEGWYSLADGAQAIINLAGASIGSGRWTGPRKQLIMQSRLDAGRAVVQAVDMVRVKPRVVIQASAVGYYGSSNDAVLDENAPSGRDFLARVAAGSEGSTQSVESMGVRHVVIRTGVVLDKNGGVLPRLVTPFRFFAGGPLGTGRQWFSWIHISDEIRAIQFLVDNDYAVGPFNLTAPFPITNGEFAVLLGSRLKRPSSLRVPSFVLRTMMGEMSNLLVEGQRVIPDRLIKLGFLFEFPQASEALRDLLT